MIRDTSMTSSAYDGCGSGDLATGTTEVTVGLFRETDTMTFTRDQWEEFRSMVDQLFAD